MATPTTAERRKREAELINLPLAQAESASQTGSGPEGIVSVVTVQPNEQLLYIHGGATDDNSSEPSRAIIVAKESGGDNQLYSSQDTDDFNDNGNGLPDYSNPLMAYSPPSTDPVEVWFKAINDSTNAVSFRVGAEFVIVREEV